MSGEHRHDACTGEPVSWLDLELYALDELPGGEVEVGRHLVECEVCRQCLESIRTDQLVLPALPTLPVEHEQKALTAERAERGRGDEVEHELAQERGFGWGWLRWALAPAAVAAAALLVVLLPGAPTNEDLLPGRRVAIKGGELAITLVRRRGEVTSQDPRTFAVADRFKVEVSCPPGQVLGWEVVVFQAGEAAFPFSPAGPLICGNREPLSGAFTVTGAARADVCLIVQPPARAALRRGPGHLPPSSACVSLKPAP